ncbi:hypothetical protein HDZ31DRAFT_77737, partial [Schizophyllum fasciatum]
SLERNGAQNAKLKEGGRVSHLTPPAKRSTGRDNSKHASVSRTSKRKPQSQSSPSDASDSNNGDAPPQRKRVRRGIHNGLSAAADGHEVDKGVRMQNQSDSSRAPRRRKGKGRAHTPPAGDEDGESDTPRALRRAPSPPGGDKGDSESGDESDVPRAPRKDRGKGRALTMPRNDEGVESDTPRALRHARTPAASDESGDESEAPRAPRKDKGKARARTPAASDESGDESEAPRAPRKDKGKGRAPTAIDEENEQQLLNVPGMFNAGDFLEDDAELPDLSDMISFDAADMSGPSNTPNANGAGPSTSTSHRRGSGKASSNTGPIPTQSISRLQTAIRNLVELLFEESIACKKPVETLWRATGWVGLDCMRSRPWTRQQVFARHWAATNAPDPGARQARMHQAYKAKLARLGSDASEEALAEHFKDDYEFCVEVQEELLLRATPHQRQRIVNQTAEQLSRVALGAHMNSGIAIVGYIADIRGGAKGAVNSTMFGGGPEYAEISCDLRLRGLKEDTEIPAVVDTSPLDLASAADQDGHPQGWFPYRNYALNPQKNRSDELIRILYAVLRWDLGAIYRLANRRLSSKHAEMPNQLPRAQLADISYQLGIVLVNWIDELANNLPTSHRVSRKPAGRSWSNRVAEMLETRKKMERQSNSEGAEGLDALQYLMDHGAVAFVPLPRSAVKHRLSELGDNPIVMSGGRRPVAYLRWRSCDMYKKDLDNGTDSRVKWQSFWEDEQDDGLVHSSDSDGDMNDEDAEKLIHSSRNTKKTRRRRRGDGSDSDKDEEHAHRVDTDGASKHGRKGDGGDSSKTDGLKSSARGGGGKRDGRRDGSGGGGGRGRTSRQADGIEAGEEDWSSWDEGGSSDVERRRRQDAEAEYRAARQARKDKDRREHRR